MTVTVKKSIAKGTITAPPSKSVAHRALICAALSGGCKVSNISYSADVSATLDCLESLGATVKRDKNSVFLGNLNPKNFCENTEIFCNESGSTLRFLLPLCLLTDKKITLKGTKRLFERPLDIFEEMCVKKGLYFQKSEDCVTVCGPLTAGKYSVRGDVSSQFVTGLLLALSTLESDSTLTILGDVQSRPYINITLEVLKIFGIDIEAQNNTFYIKGGQKFNATDYFVEGDCSNAAFLDSFNLLGGEVSVLGINPDTSQGDYVYKAVFEGLRQGKKEFDLSDCPDLAPILFALSAYLGGAKFTGTKRLKIKESNRAVAMQTELSKFGITAKVLDDEVIIEGGSLTAPTETLCSHNDHRIVMSLSVLCSITGGTISGAEAVNKSYPNFFEDIQKLRIGLDFNEA